MSQRVLATEAALQAAKQMQSVLNGGLQQQVRQLLAHGQALSNPNAWDSREAGDFRQRSWPGARRSLTQSLQSLVRLQADSEKVIRDIMAAGNGGPVRRPVVAPDGAGRSPGETDLSSDELKRDFTNPRWMSPTHYNDQYAKMNLPPGYPPKLSLWGYSNGQANTSIGSPDDVVQDVNQHDLGDCWFMAGLLAVAKRDPNFIQNHIHQNPNGTYTVDLYQDGKLVPVTVSGDLPFATYKEGDKSDAFPYAQPGPRGAIWPMLYEKAYAQLNGGYTKLDAATWDPDLWDTSGRSMQDITGGSSDYKVWVPPTVDIAAGLVIPALPVGLLLSGANDAPSLADINAKLQQGDAVTVATLPRGLVTGHLLDHPSGSEPFDLGNGQNLHPDHTYVVDSVNLGAHPPTITLLNPWGPDLADQKVTINQDQLQQYGGVVRWMNVPGNTPQEMPPPGRVA